MLANHWKEILDSHDLIFYPGTGGVYTKGPDGKLAFYVGFARQNTQLHITKFYCDTSNQEAIQTVRTLCLIHSIPFNYIAKQ